MKRRDIKANPPAGFDPERTVRLPDEILDNRKALGALYHSLVRLIYESGRKTWMINDIEYLLSTLSDDLLHSAIQQMIDDAICTAGASREDFN